MSFIPQHRIFALANSDGGAVITSRLDCDIYKFVMGQFIWAEGYADVPVTFALKIRTKGLKMGRVIPEAALRAQLDALQKLRFSETELSQLGGMTITNKLGVKRHMFELGYLDELRRRHLPHEFADDRNLENPAIHCTASAFGAPPRHQQNYQADQRGQ